MTWVQSCLAASSVFRCYALPNSNLYRHSNPGQTLLFWAGAGDDQCRCGKNLRPLNQGHTRQGRTASLPTDPPKLSTIKTGSCCKALSSIDVHNPQTGNTMEYHTRYTLVNTYTNWDGGSVWSSSCESVDPTNSP